MSTTALAADSVERPSRGFRDACMSAQSMRAMERQQLTPLVGPAEAWVMHVGVSEGNTEGCDTGEGGGGGGACAGSGLRGR